MNLLRCSPLLLLLALPGWTGQVWAAEAEAPKDEALKAEAPKAEAPKEAPKLTYSKGGADTCLGCHDDVVTLAIFRGPHGSPNDPHAPFGHGQLQCEACHGPGGLHVRKPKSGEKRTPVVRFSSDSQAPVAVQNRMCSACHQADLGVGWHTSAHATNEVACASCHRSHGATDPVLKVATQPDVCASCHQIVRMDAHRAYAHPIDAGKMGCSDCHSVHGTGNEALLVKKSTNDTCFLCHADKRGPFLWEHAPATEDCAACHVPHGSIHPAMLRMPGPMLCKSCHSEANHPSLAPTASTGLPGGSRSTYVLGMNCLNCHSKVHGSNHPSGSTLMR